jgi:hypothetical protein
MPFPPQWTNNRRGAMSEEFSLDTEDVEVTRTPPASADFVISDNDPTDPVVVISDNDPTDPVI